MAFELAFLWQIELEEKEARGARKVLPKYSHWPARVSLGASLLGWDLSW